MRGVHLFAGVLAAVLLADAGCSSARRDASGSTAAATATVAPRAHQRNVAAPANPDLGTVIERFYQQIEGEHWRFAYAMLSPRYRATLTPEEFQRRYDVLLSPDVTAQQLGGSTVVVRIDAKDRADRTRAIHLEETVKLAWDGEQWTIDRIERRSVSAASTR
jgi:hypothetical protein